MSLLIMLLPIQIAWPPRLLEKAKSFLGLNFNVYINVDNRERTRAALEREIKKQRRPISLENKT